MGRHFTLLATLALLSFGCAQQAKQPAQGEDASLQRWLDDELAPYLAQQLGQHPRFKGESVILVRLDGPDIQADIDGLTRSVRDQLMDSLLTDAGVRLPWQPQQPPAQHHRRLDQVECGRIRDANYYIGIEISRSATAQYRVSVRALDVRAGERVSGFGKSWAGDLTSGELRALQDWFLRFELATVPGVSEVAAVGGFVREYQVLVDPNRLRAFDIPLVRVRQAVKAASMEVGGRVLERAETELMIRSKGYVSSLEDLQRVVVQARNGTPVLLTDVARVIEGPELRRGVVELNGEGEVVGAVVVMRYGENARTTITRVKNRLSELQDSLPEGVEVVETYNRSALIDRSVDTLKTKLVEEFLVDTLVGGLLVKLRQQLGIGVPRDLFLVERLHEQLACTSPRACSF